MNLVGRRRVRPWRKVVLPAVLALATAAAARLLHRVEGDSMAPSLQAGDVLVALPGRLRLRRGTMVLVADPRQPSRVTVKRVVALAGDWSDLGGVPATVPPGHVAVAGDNRGRSTDSRHYGAVALSAVRGRVVARLLPAPGRVAGPGRGIGSGRGRPDRGRR